MYRGTAMVVECALTFFKQNSGSLTKKSFGAINTASFQIMCALKFVFKTEDFDTLIKRHGTFVAAETLEKVKQFVKVFISKHPDQIAVASVTVNFAEVDTTNALQANQDLGLYNNYRATNKCIWQKKYEDLEKRHNFVLQHKALRITGRIRNFAEFKSTRICIQKVAKITPL